MQIRLQDYIPILLTHWGRVTHTCVAKLIIIGSDNSLSPGRRQAIMWTNAEILLIGPLGTNFIEIFIGIQTFSFKKMHLKMSSAKWRPCCLGLNVLVFPLSALNSLIWGTPHYFGQISQLLMPSQRAHDAIITSLWRQNDVARSFWHHANDVIYVVCGTSTSYGALMISWALPLKLLSRECHKIPLAISKHWFR